MANGSRRGFVSYSYSVELGAMDPEVTGRKASLHLTEPWSFKDRFARILTWVSDDGWAEPDPVRAVDGFPMSSKVSVREDKKAAKAEEKWWTAVQDTIRENADLLEKVRRSTIMIATHISYVCSLYHRFPIY